MAQAVTEEASELHWSDRFRRLTQSLCSHALPAGFLLFGCYLLVSLLLDPGGYLGTDTGTKVYTLEVMTNEGTASPGIGYWAEDLDPSGSLHPVHQTERQSDGSWVGVSTLPMLELARPLYELGGYRFTLVLPMLGGVAAAFAARFLTRQLRPSSSGWLAFWSIGLGSPVLVYSLDFWEHSAGVAFMLWGVVALLSVLDGRPPWFAAAAGLAFGAGAVMRQEVIIYGLVATAVVCTLMLVERRRPFAALVAGGAVVVGFAVPWFANGVLESAVAGQARASRSSSTATAAVSATASTTVQRIEEGAQTLLGLVAGDIAVSVLLGLAVVMAVVAAVRAERRGDRTFAVVALGASAAVYLADAVGGLGFVPGLLTAFPLAIGGLLFGWRGPGRSAVIVAISVLALPLVYAFQYLGASAPQWGGRYTLASGAMLGIVGLVAMNGSGDQMRVVRTGLLALSFLVTGLGAMWLVERSHGVDEFFDRVVAEAEPVVIARQAFLLREAGAAAVGRSWLSVEDEDEFIRAVDVARRTGAERFSVLEWEGPSPPDSAIPDDVAEVDRVLLEFVNTPVGLVTYEFINDVDS